MDKLPCEIIMLQVDKAVETGDLAKCVKKSNGGDVGRLVICFDQSWFNIRNQQDIKKARYWEPQYLYFTSNREVEDGDWCYNIFIDDQGVETQRVFTKRVGLQYQTTSTQRKIEASTNPLLNLPGIPESFMKSYVAVNGNILTANIQIVENLAGHIVIKENLTNDKPAFFSFKTTKDNCVIITDYKIRNSNVYGENTPRTWQSTDQEQRFFKPN